jgi:hypothetical protein
MSLAIHNCPTRVSNRASPNNPGLKVSPEARTAYRGSSINPAMIRRPTSIHIQRRNKATPFFW